MKGCNNAKDHGAQKTGKLFLLLVCAAALLFACENAAYNEALLAIQEKAGGGTKTGDETGTDDDVYIPTFGDGEEDTGQPNVGGGEGGYTGVAVTSIKLYLESEEATTLELEAGETVQLTAITDPPDIPVTWFSSKTSAVTVSETGLVTMVNGAANITAKAGGKTATCKVETAKGSEGPGLYIMETDTNTGELVNTGAVENYTHTGLASALEWISANKENGDHYLIALGEHEPNTDATHTIIANITVTLKGTESGDMENNITITKTNPGSLLSVGGSLILEDITLKGNESNTDPLVSVGGTLTMKAGSRITGNTRTNTSLGGGGVSVSAGGNFTMEDGSIDDNTATATNLGAGMGGGVYNSGAFTMTGGAIKDNTAGDNTRSTSQGGGVYSSGTFTMTGGTIRENKTKTIDEEVDWVEPTPTGGGVYINVGSFTMSGDAEISDNETISSKYGSGGGVYVYRGSFTMSSGTIKGNKSASGGGVHILGNNNDATSSSFYMTGGVIEGNKAAINGAGVNKIGKKGIFTKTGGIIYGTTAAGGKANCKVDEVDVTVHAIAAVKKDTTINLYRDEDADANVNLDFSTEVNWSK